jgi:hypothetical protein
MPSTIEDDGLLAGGAVLLALVAVGVALLRDGGRRVINIPSDFGQSDGSSVVDETAPDDLQSPGGTEGKEWEYEEPSDNPSNSDEELDFGDANPGAPSPTAPSIPDSLAGFDPAGRVDLVDQDDGGTWVGL